MLGDVTRNAVIGKVHRLGLSGRGAPHRERRSRPSTPRRSVSAVLRRASAPSEIVPVQTENMQVAVDPVPAENVPHRPHGNPASIFTLTDSTCHWPIGDPGTEDFHFCGLPAVPGTPYCEACARIAYQPTQKSRDRRRAAG
jgi:GcrA cell cycle regulator